MLRLTLILAQRWAWTIVPTLTMTRLCRPAVTLSPAICQPPPPPYAISFIAKASRLRKPREDPAPRGLHVLLNLTVGVLTFERRALSRAKRSTIDVGVADTAPVGID